MNLISMSEAGAAVARVDWRAAAEETHNCYDVDAETPGIAWLNPLTGEMNFAENMGEIDGLVVLKIWESMEHEGEEVGRRPNTPTKVVKYAFAPWVGTIELSLRERMTSQVEEYCSSAGW
jgi:hypothetical protein